ncbi:MAG: Bacterial regulatory protein arsR family [Verrucomicrobiota bacterium]|jgi:DNA-binding transcriptional ArsR family regulator
MTQLHRFLSALADSSRLRLLHLLQQHRITVSELRAVLGLGEGDLAAHLKLLVDTGLIKTGKNSGQLKLKHKHAALIAKLFAHFKVGTKKDEQIRADEKKLHALRHPKTEKKAKKPVAKKKPANK